MSRFNLQPGDIVRIFDRETRPPKIKRHICICVRRQLCLRINSKSIFKPCHLLTAANNHFLEHDSYVELMQLTRVYAYELDQAEKIGKLSASEAAALLRSVSTAKTLSEAHKRLIAEQISGLC